MPHLAFVLLLPAFLQVAGAEQVEAVELLQRRLLLSSATPEPFVLEDALPMTWVHIPKCGSSFLNVLVNMPDFCPGLEPNAVIDEDSLGPSYLLEFIRQCPSWCDERNFRCFTLAHGCVGDSYATRKGTLVGMFRQPEQRLLSAYHDVTHVWDFEGPESFANVTLMDKHEITLRPRPPLDVFAQLFGGTMAYQIAAQGNPNRTSSNFRSMGKLSEIPERTMDMAQEAARRVREGFAFVGITEQWDLSICLFHAMFGGPCLAVEFEDTRSTLANKSAEDLYDTAPLQGFKDHVDGLVYQEALRVFSDNVQKYNVSFETCRHTCFGPAFG
mmetsp:Transcript_38502/g.68899  ORF Transcript_38502/g.68899 Transcript_38502/m.68899 type:complete len:328 (-) Transcript_38502:36-1019(-)